MKQLNRVLPLKHWKILSLAAAMLLIGYVIMNTRLIEAILAFSFGGVVPGTDIILSPDTMIWSVIGILGLFLLVLIGRIIYKTYMAIRSKPKRSDSSLGEGTPISVRVQTAPASAGIIWTKQADASKTPATAQAQAQQSGPVMQSRPAQRLQLQKRQNQQARSAASAWAKLRHMSWSQLTRVRSASASSLKITGAAVVMASTGIVWAFRSGSKKTAGVTRRLSRTTYRGLKTATAYSLASAAQAGRWTVRTGGDLWRWAEPRLWSFDGWLELQVRKIEKWLARTVGKYRGNR